MIKFYIAYLTIGRGDTNFLIISNSPKKVQKQLNIDLKLSYNWILANKISLNSKKTEVIITQKP